MEEVMEELVIREGGALRGRVRVPGDKSISHRTLLLGMLADGNSHVRGFLPAADCLATLGCVRALGVAVERPEPTALIIHGRGLDGLRRPDAPLNCVRSGTSMRLLAGILAGQPFESTLTGDPQLLRRPMERIARPLRRMGAEIETVEGHAPLTIHGRRLHGHDHALPVASAQVKSAILLAGLYAEGETIVRQPGPARDHTERMLAAMDADITVTGLNVILAPSPPHPLTLSPLSLTVPGDISSAAFLLVAGLLVPGSEVGIKGVGVNETRTGLLDVLAGMAADVALDDRREQGGEPVVRMIDEFPVLAVAATQAEGETVVREAEELRVKETDRIAVIASELRKMGARIEPQPDGFVVEGPTRLQGAVVDSHGDHRIAMALAVAGLIAEGETTVEDTACIADSFPGFADTMRALGAIVNGKT
jgi:3-phosphoshikimate 1-carboxyvinyltransferase